MLIRIYEGAGLKPVRLLVFPQAAHGGLSALPAAQAVVQVLVVGVTYRFVYRPPDPVQPGDGLYRLLPGEIVVEVAVDVFVAFQHLQGLLQVTYRVHYDMVARRLDTYHGIAPFEQGPVGEEIHEALEHVHVLLPRAGCLFDDGNVFLPDAPFIIRIAHLVAARYVPEGDGEVMPPVQFVVYLPTELPGGLRIYTPRMDIRQERMVVQRHHLDAFHHLLYRVGHGVVGTGAEQGSRARLHLYEPKDLAHARCPQEQHRQLYDTPAFRQSEVIPFVQPVVDLEGGCVLFSQRGQVPILSAAHLDGFMAEQPQVVYDSYSFCLYRIHGFGTFSVVFLYIPAN